MTGLSPRQRLLIKARGRARERYWSAYDQDDHSCTGCGRDVPLEVHHRDGDALNNELVNLVALCHRCHQTVHRRQATRERVEAWKDSLDEVTSAPAAPHKGTSGLALVAADGGERS